MKFRDANLQVHEKSSFAHPPSYILPSLSKNTSRLLLPKSLWKCATKISFSCSITIPPSQLSSCRRCSWTFSWVQFLSNKLKLICFLRCKITRISFFFAYALYFDICYFDICIKLTLSLIISTMKKSFYRNP